MNFVDLKNFRIIKKYVRDFVHYSFLIESYRTTVTVFNRYSQFPSWLFVFGAHFALWIQIQCHIRTDAVHFHERLERNTLRSLEVGQHRFWNVISGLMSEFKFVCGAYWWVAFVFSATFNHFTWVIWLKPALSHWNTFILWKYLII